MTVFIDLYFDDLVPGFPCDSSPRFSTQITQVASGAERRNRQWAHPLRRFILPEAIREQETYEAVHDHWLLVGGPECTFPFRDPLDFATVPLVYPNIEPDWDGEDQAFGTGDGFERTFQLTKTYQRGAYSYTRPIYLPVVGSYVILMNGLDPATPDPALPGGPYTYVVSRPGGVVTFTPAPEAGIDLTWGGLFDVEVRFEADDSFAGIVQSYRIAGFADINLIETRSC